MIWTAREAHVLEYAVVPVRHWWLRLLKDYQSQVYERAGQDKHNLCDHPLGQRIIRHHFERIYVG
jgi:hypothetical protein